MWFILTLYFTSGLYQCWNTHAVLTQITSAEITRSHSFLLAFINRLVKFLFLLSSGLRKGAARADNQTALTYKVLSGTIYFFCYSLFWKQRQRLSGIKQPKSNQTLSLSSSVQLDEDQDQIHQVHRSRKLNNPHCNRETPRDRNVKPTCNTSLSMRELLTSEHSNTYREMTYTWTLM